MEFYKCGQIMTTHGIKGDLKVKNLSDFDRFTVGARLYILHNNDYIEVKVKKSSPFGKYLLVAFEGLEDINLVLKYHSDFIYISSEDRHDELEENAFYYTDLMGLMVYNQHNEPIGEVKEVVQMPQCYYLALDVNGKRKLIPFIEEFVTEVSDKIIINEIEGLIWQLRY